MTTIRRATPEDLPGLCALALREHARSRLSHHPVDHAHMRQSFLAAMQGLTSVVFVSEQGGSITGLIGGMVQPSLLNRYQTAFELLWYAEDGSGLRLLAAFRHWARRMRAVELVVHNYAGIADPARFDKAMARCGFGILGTTYVSALES